MASLRNLVYRRMLRGLRPMVRRELLARFGSLDPSRHALQGLRGDTDKLELRLLQLEEALRYPLFHPGMTVAQAWSLHPGVREVFTRHHLPDCDLCPVAEDETLEEVAEGRGFSLSLLLEELDALLSQPSVQP